MRYSYDAMTYMAAYCPYCGEMVDGKPQHCPACGGSFQSRPGRTYKPVHGWVFLSIGFLLVLTGIAGIWVISQNQDSNTIFTSGYYIIVFISFTFFGVLLLLKGFGKKTYFDSWLWTR